MESIFNGAQFDDKFVTRDGRIAIYIASHKEQSIYNDNIVTIEHTYALPNRCTIFWCNNEGINLNALSDLDIVSKYQEPENSIINDNLVYKWFRNKTACGLADAKSFINQLIDAIKHKPTFRTDSKLKLVYEPYEVTSFCDWVFSQYNDDIPIYTILGNYLKEKGE